MARSISLLLRDRRMGRRIAIAIIIDISESDPSDPILPNLFTNLMSINRSYRLCRVLLAMVSHPAPAFFLSDDVRIASIQAG